MNTGTGYFSFVQRPFDQLKEADPRHKYRQLLLWHAEDKIKKGYASLMDALEVRLSRSMYLGFTNCVYVCLMPYQSLLYSFLLCNRTVSRYC